MKLTLTKLDPPTPIPCGRYEDGDEVHALRDGKKYHEELGIHCALRLDDGSAVWTSHDGFIGEDAIDAARLCGATAEDPIAQKVRVLITALEGGVIDMVNATLTRSRPWVNVGCVSEDPWAVDSVRIKFPGKEEA